MSDLPDWAIALILKPFVALFLMVFVVAPIRYLWRSAKQARRERRDRALGL
jgi:hypothetical protein